MNTKEISVRRALRSVLTTLILVGLCALATPRLAAARPPQGSPLAFQVSTVDAATGAAKSSFYLGEPVSVVFSVTNQSGVAQTITELAHTEIPVTLSAKVNDSARMEVREGIRGGTSSSSVGADGTIYFIETPKTSMTLAPGQRVSVSISDLGRFFATKLDPGSYTLTATYNGTQQSQASFTVAIDEARSVPILEQSAASQDEGERRWAEAYLGLIRKPSVSGRVTAAGGQPLGGVHIGVTGSETTNIETRPDGGFDLTHLAPGGSYTLTPSSEGFTFEPPRRTFSNVSGKLTGANFTATRVRTGVNVASEDAGAVARASSTFNEDYPVDSVINGSRSGIGWSLGSGGWKDATPGAFPDWVEVSFNGTKSIDWVNVFTLQDNHSHPAEPTLTQTFTLYGITDFDVQYWDGAAWRVVPGGSVTANNKVWRQFTFPTVSTSKIRVYVRNAKDGHSRLTEVEAFHANVPPTVQLLGTYEGPPGATFQFNHTASDPDGEISRYEWDFGDNTDATGPTQSHTYPKAGTYTVTLRVTDDGGETTSTTATVRVADPPQPPAAVPGGPYQGGVGSRVSFEGRASSDPDGTISAYSWDFGDNTTASGATPTHTYTRAGTYNVTLTVTDNSGMSASATTVSTITLHSPSDLLATTGAGAQINLAWAASGQPHHYQIERATSLNGPYVALAASPTTTSFTDTAPGLGGVYFYRVCAVDAAGNKSGYTNADLATTFVFTDPELYAGVTPVRAQHVTELRQAVDAVRLAVGLQPAAWTTPQLPGQLIRALHIQELRTSLGQALGAVGVPAPAYTDSQLSAGYLIRKAHIEELRQGLK